MTANATIANSTASSFDPDNCTLATCSIDDSFYAYIPALPENSFFIMLFGISFLLFNWQAWRHRTWAFHAGVFIGCILEILGYVGRVQSHFNVFDVNAFLSQIVSLTIAPAAISASIYICLSRIVSSFGNSEVAMMSSRWYTIIFMVGDFVSLFFQSAGGGMASVASQNGTDPTTGNNLMIVGLGLQVLFLTLFMAFAAEFAVRVSRNRSKLSPLASEVLGTRDFKIFVAGLFVATITIYIRSVYRVIELAQGWKGHLVSVQVYFIVLEGIMVVISAFALNVAHPGSRFKAGYFAKAKKADEKTASEV